MGELFVVSTPIGNLEDITLRAIRVLKGVDLIAAEDTRTTKILLSRYHIPARLTSYHEHNKKFKSEHLVRYLKENKNVALVSEAGTPGISDPGYYLIRLAIQQGIKIVPIPGPSAFLAALVVSGLPLDSFVFYGFVPRKGGKRKKWLREIEEESKTIVFYESPYRLLSTLKDLIPVTGERILAIGRELTKKFEEFKRGKALELKEYFEKHPPRGEFVILVNGKS